MCVCMRLACIYIYIRLLNGQEGVLKNVLDEVGERFCCAYTRIIRICMDKHRVQRWRLTGYDVHLLK